MKKTRSTKEKDPKKRGSTENPTEGMEETQERVYSGRVPVDKTVELIMTTKGRK